MAHSARWTAVGYDYIPCVVNTFGGIGSRLTAYVRKLADYVETRMGIPRATFQAYWTRTLAITAVVASSRELWSAHDSVVVGGARSEYAIDIRSARQPARV